MDPISIALLGSGAISGAGSLLSSGLQFISQGWSQNFNKNEAALAREFNAEEAKKARDFSALEAATNRQFEAQQAEINRQWQSDMSNSAYQRGVSDLRAAGLNPNLVSGGAMQAATGSSGVPQGSQASSASASGSAASSSPLHFNNMFSGIANALNAYATLNNQKIIAAMYNDTSRGNNQRSNMIRKSISNDWLKAASTARVYNRRYY